MSITIAATAVISAICDLANLCIPLYKEKQKKESPTNEWKNNYLFKTKKYLVELKKYIELEKTSPSCVDKEKFPLMYDYNELCILKNDVGYLSGDKNTPYKYFKKIIKKLKENIIKINPDIVYFAFKDTDMEEAYNSKLRDVTNKLFDNGNYKIPKASEEEKKEILDWSIKTLKELENNSIPI